MVRQCPPAEHRKVAQHEEGGEVAPGPGDEKGTVSQTDSAALEKVHRKEEAV